jgi:hypothetical protein
MVFGHSESAECVRALGSVQIGDHADLARCGAGLEDRLKPGASSAQSPGAVGTELRHRCRMLSSKQAARQPRILRQSLRCPP